MKFRIIIRAEAANDLRNVFLWYEDKTSAIIEVPVQLLSAVRKLITQYQISHLPKTTIKR